MQFLVRVHKASRWFLDRRLKRLSGLVDVLIRLVYSARVPATADIHPTVHFSHNALAVVITKESRIGAGCIIGTHVLLGSRWGVHGGPVIEEDVIIHAGAKVVGPIRIGRGSVLGANTVVLDDVPPYSLAAGIPAVIKKSGIRADQYRPEAAAAAQATEATA
jgi:serine O-acetyltransferase